MLKKILLCLYSIMFVVYGVLFFSDDSPTYALLILALIVGFSPVLLAYMKYRPHLGASFTQFSSQVAGNGIPALCIHFVLVEIVEQIRCGGDGFCGIIGFFGFLWAGGIFIVAFLFMSILFSMVRWEMKRKSTEKA